MSQFFIPRRTDQTSAAQCSAARCCRQTSCSLHVANPGSAARAAGPHARGLRREWGTVQHGHRPAAVIYPQRASAVAACRSSGVVGVAAQIPACPIMPTHRAKCSQLSAVFNGKLAPLIGSTINPRFTAPDRRPADGQTDPGRPGGDKASPANQQRHDVVQNRYPEKVDQFAHR